MWPLASASSLTSLSPGSSLWWARPCPKPLTPVQKDMNDYRFPPREPLGSGARGLLAPCWRMIFVIISS